MEAALPCFRWQPGTASTVDKAEIVVQSLASGERKVVFRGGSGARYVPTGHLVYGLLGSLFAIAFDAQKLEVRGGSVPVITGVMRAREDVS